MNLELLIELIMGSVVALGSFALAQAFTTSSNVRRRLSQGRSAATSRSALFRDDRPANRLLHWVQGATGLGDSAEGQKLRRDLALAGFEQPSTPAYYVIARFALTIAPPYSVVALQTTLGLSQMMLLIACVALAVLGFMGPSLYVSQTAQARRQEIEHEFPDALDLMVVCIEAGLGLDSAFIRVGQEIHQSHPRVAEAFNRLATELRAGRSRTDALRAFAQRTDAEAIRAFVALLIQTDTLGTSIGQTLRGYSNEMRTGRFLKAEEKAMRVPVLMTVPLIVCILPVICTALLLPPLIDVTRVLIPSMTHHQSSTASPHHT